MPGDIVRVETGDCIPADLRLVIIESISMQAGQASLTGESVPVNKQVKPLGESAKMIQDQTNMLFSSTVVNGGSAVAVVVYTGMKTAIGTIQEEVTAAREEEEDTPLKKKLDQFSN